MTENNTIPINQRLLTARGHLKAVTEMVDSNVPHKVVLHQLHAVQAALKAVSQMIIGENIEECFHILVTSKSSEESQKALDSLLVLYNLSFNQK